MSDATVPDSQHPAKEAPGAGRSTSIVIDDDVRGLLLALAGDWKPKALAVSPVSELRYRDLDLLASASSVSIERGRLIVTIGEQALSRHLHQLVPLSLGDGVQGKLVDGAVFRGPYILRISRNGRAEATLEAGEWTVLGDPAPHLWIGSVENPTDIAFGGNLVIERIRPDGLSLGRARHFRFNGTYTYYLVQTGGRADCAWFLLVNTGKATPDREVLEREFLALQFALGRQLRVEQFSGVTPEQQTVGAVSGVGTRLNLSNTSAPPLPIVRNNEDRIDDSWAPLLFERVVATMNTRLDWHRAYTVAFDSYLDAMSSHLDADYLRLQVALEAFSYWILRLLKKGEQTIVKDKGTWKAWVADHAISIRELASPGFEKNLYDKVVGVYRLSSGRVVPSAFGLFDIQLTEEMQSELEARNVVVHQGVMAEEYDVEREVRRIAMVRTLLVALVARSVGYSGAINGWELGAGGYPIEPSPWWTVDEADREAANAVYLARG